MGVFTFDTENGDTGTCELQLSKTYPTIPAEAVAAMLPWPLRITDNIEECAPPIEEELRWLRHLDPGPTYLRPGRY
jgi:hypothetical protein